MCFVRIITKVYHSISQDDDEVIMMVMMMMMMMIIKPNLNKKKTKNQTSEVYTDKSSHDCRFSVVIFSLTDLQLRL